MAKRTPKKANSGATLGFEATPCAAADKLHKNMDAAEYKHIVLGLISLKYISDAFEERHTLLVSQQADGADPFDQRMRRLATSLRAQIEQERTLDEEIQRDLEALGYGG